MGCCKVGVVADRRTLTISANKDIHEYLVARWVGEGDYPAIGVRKLADWFNKKLLREAYASHGRNVTDVRIDSEYEVLTGDDEIRKAEVVDDLRSDGLDGEELLDDFISRSTMRRHLTNCLGVSKGDTDDSDTDWERDQIRYGKEKFERNVREAVRSLDNKERVPGGSDADIDVSVLLSCPECSTQVRLQTAIERGFICEEHLGPSFAATPDFFNTVD